MDQTKSNRMLPVLMAGIILFISGGCATAPVGGSASKSAAAVTASASDVIQFSNTSSGQESHILVIDPMGRKIGYDLDNGVELNEVPSGDYNGVSEAQQVSIRNPIAGSYTFVIGGSQVGEFAAGITYAEDQLVDSRDFRGEIREGNAFYAIVELHPESREPLQFSVFQYN
jgi:hypothetical protein